MKAESKFKNHHLKHHPKLGWYRVQSSPKQGELFPTDEEMVEMEAEMNPCHGCSFYSDCNQNYHVCGTQRRLDNL